MTEDEHCREVYAHFGLAVYLAQVLENGLVNALLFLDFLPNQLPNFKTQSEWEDQHDAFAEARYALTMGNLIRELRKIMEVPLELEDDLKVSLDKRKYLVHHYFREKVMLFLTEQGRQSMIDELSEFGNLFTRTDRLLESLLQPTYQKYNFTTEWQEKIMEELRADAMAGSQTKTL